MAHTGDCLISALRMDGTIMLVGILRHIHMIPYLTAEILRITAQMILFLNPIGMPHSRQAFVIIACNVAGYAKLLIENFKDYSTNDIISGGTFTDAMPEHIFRVKTLDVHTDDVRITGVRVVGEV